MSSNKYTVVLSDSWPPVLILTESRDRGLGIKNNLRHFWMGASFFSNFFAEGIF